MASVLTTGGARHMVIVGVLVFVVVNLNEASLNQIGKLLYMYVSFLLCRCCASGVVLRP